MQAFPLCSHVRGALLYIATPSNNYTAELSRNACRKAIAFVMYRICGPMRGSQGKSLIVQVLE